MARHIMALVGPSKGDITRPHLGNWRAMCKCGGLDGPERATRSQAVDDFEFHAALVEVTEQYAEAMQELADR